MSLCLSGNSMKVVARIIASTTRSDDQKDVELNVAAWTEESVFFSVIEHHLFDDCVKHERQE